MTQTERRQFGKYEIIEEIGRGGFAVVHRAEDSQLGREVALKILSPAFLNDPTFVERFQQEARTAARLRHPRIVTIYELGQIEQRYYIAMDLIPGGSLREYLAEKGALPWREAAQIITQAAEALAYAHRQGVVHRDLKPANILLDPEMGAMLTDFGFARLLDGSAYSMTVSGGVVGTPAYLPVEVWEGRKAGPPADVYALGCTLYEMLTGDKLFPGDTPIAVMRLHDKGAKWPNRWPPNLPPGLPALVAQATAVQPEARYADAAAFLNALQAAAAPQAPTIAPPPQPLPEKTVAPTEQPVQLPHIISGEPPLKFEYCFVPAGPFTMGEGDEEHTVTLPEYYLARFPTTNAQYRFFVEAGGYEQQEWWTPDGWTWRQKEKISQPLYWNDKKWNAPNLPVVGVSWYEAAAFCAWAASVTGEPIRLPNEAKWEKGARGTDKREYPWGNQSPDGKLCNFNRNISQTTPLGRYSPQGDSPYGCADMSGNVWDWCRTIYKSYPYKENDGRESLNGTNGRVLRGGSWSVNQANARAAYRYFYHPVYRYYNVGFRVVVCRPPSHDR